jgi:DnaJ-class molecular chaperone
MKRFYEIRNFKSADAAEIKKAYRKALEHHPDKILRQIGRRKVQSSC